MSENKIEAHESGGMSFVGPKAVDVYRVRAVHLHAGSGVEPQGAAYDRCRCAQGLGRSAGAAHQRRQRGGRVVKQPWEIMLDTMNGVELILRAKERGLHSGQSTPPTHASND